MDSEPSGTMSQNKLICKLFLVLVLYYSKRKVTNTVSLCRPGWPGTCCVVDQAWLKIHGPFLLLSGHLVIICACSISMGGFKDRDSAHTLSTGSAIHSSPSRISFLRILTTFLFPTLTAIFMSSLPSMRLQNSFYCKKVYSRVFFCFFCPFQFTHESYMLSFMEIPLLSMLLLHTNSKVY